MKRIILIVICYNIVFIPLQFAYRLEYTTFYILMEIITVVSYTLDIYHRIKNLIQLNKMKGNLPESEKEIERTLMDNIEHFKKRVSNLKTEIVTSCIAVLPFSMVFEMVGLHNPILITNTLCLLRLVKVYPLIKLFDYLRSVNMQKFRILEVMITYYLLNHIFTCIWLSMGLNADDTRDTWIRRIPVPLKEGIRPTSSIEDMTPLSLYIHSLYFNVNTISHVAIGDITAITLSERLYVSILILFGTFIYCFLFGNIVSIVSDFAPNQQHNYFEKFQFIQ